MHPSDHRDPLSRTLSIALAMLTFLVLMPGAALAQTSPF